ncbi:DUF1778 domain-containing protein [Jatrophihabitans cynanchi]|uniref:DUF1778 domain-containing protein n=1 Tax=Jatrophihabitans cynanchi TaxID=2944128 RepID=A0ABY7JW15_9ACTN|nr:DUF1778 domain-containing protein [Jatrophihabitans sp. SB3-54]WAX55101.1 DUF1778 domain-containing protein [Jatrophihabitans sp. SB3-54]
MPATKSARLNLRLNADDDALLRQAAAALGQSVSEFLTSSAVERAHDVLADQRHFDLDVETWNRFVAILDEPAEPDPALVSLFSRPSRIER